MFQKFHMWRNVFQRELHSLIEGGCMVIYYYDRMNCCNSEVYNEEKSNEALLPVGVIFYFPFIAFLQIILKECYQDQFLAKCKGSQHRAVPIYLVNIIPK